MNATNTKAKTKNAMKKKTKRLDSHQPSHRSNLFSRRGNIQGTTRLLSILFKRPRERLQQAAFSALR